MSFTETLYKELEAGLQDITHSAENELQLAELSLHLTRSVLQQLKVHILEEGFADRSGEISFFKATKPQFHRHLFFFRECYSFEEKRPLGEKESLVSYYSDTIARVRLFFSRHEWLYNYYRLGRSDQDEQLFVRNMDLSGENPEFDNRFSTPASFERAKILAMEMFLQRLSEQLYALEHNQPISGKAKGAPLVWTDSKAAFIELAYALQSSGSINQGKTSVAQVMAALGAFFGVDAGNYYAVFQQNIRIRKKRRTVYLDFLTESLEKRMDESDENPRYK